jgi:hypothetical protein
MSSDDVNGNVSEATEAGGCNIGYSNRQGLGKDDGSVNKTAVLVSWIYRRHSNFLTARELQGGLFIEKGLCNAHILLYITK